MKFYDFFVIICNHHLNREDLHVKYSRDGYARSKFLIV